MAIRKISIRAARCISFLVVAGLCIVSAVRAADPDIVRTGADSAAVPHDTSTKREPLINSSAPTRRPDGEKWRLGYVDSGDYEAYARTLLGLVHGLALLDWLSLPKDIPADLDSKQLWLFLANNVNSDYVEFVGDAWWQPGNFDAEKRPAVRQSIMNRLSTSKDLDLIIAMGTWAGQDMVALQTPIPTVVASTSDPVGAHIIHSPEDSGLDNLHARVDPERYQRQVRLFHDVIPFKRLGLVYEDTHEGRTYSALDAVQQVARERGFATITCHAAGNGVSLAQATRNVLDCYQRLAPDIDAAYVTVHRGITQNSIRPLARILRDAGIPSFSMLGTAEVEQGILLGLAQANSSQLGMFYAQTIGRIFNGSKARQLNQIREDSTKLAINLYTARMIGFDPPVDALLAADEIFEEEQ